MEAERLPGCPKGVEKSAKRGSKAPQNHKKTSLYFQHVFELTKSVHNLNLHPFGYIWDAFWELKSLIVHVIFWLRFLMGFWRLLCVLWDLFLVDCCRSFLVLVQTLRKKPHPTNLLQIAVRSRVGRLKKGGKTIQQVSTNPFQNQLIF